MDSMAFHFIRYGCMYRPMSVSIDFSWYKDANGYRLVKKGSLPDGKPLSDRIMPNGGALVLIRPLETVDLYMLFAYVDSAEKMLDFVERFGLPGSFRFPYGKDYDASYDIELQFGMRVNPYLKQAALFLEALRRKAEGPEQLGAFFKSNGMVSTYLGQLRLVPDKELGARFEIKPIGLMEALWLQLGQVLASNIKLSTCLQCGRLFEIGRGSGRRADAKFCSDEHRTLYHSLNRKTARRS